MNLELQSGIEPYSRAKLHSGFKLHNEENAHYNSEVSTHDKDTELPKRSVHSDSKNERQNVETRIEPRISKYVRRNHPIKKIIGSKDARPMTRNRLKNESCLLSQIEPKIVKDTLENDDWYKDTEEKIEKIEKNKTWSLFPRPTNKNVIGTKWVFRNKLDENGEITRNKATLVCKGYA